MGAWYYKEYRELYELHKSCCFKMGCTFVFVLIQIMCAKNYTCKRNQPMNIELLSIPTEPKRTQEKETSITFKQDFDTKKQVKFIDDTSLLPPSFNLNSYQQSTPMRPNTKLNSVSSQTSQLPTSLNLNSYQESTSEPKTTGTTTSTQTHLTKVSSKIHTPQIHANDKIDKLDDIIFDIDQNDTILPSETKSCQIS